MIGQVSARASTKRRRPYPLSLSASAAFWIFPCPPSSLAFSVSFVPHLHLPQRRASNQFRSLSAVTQLRRRASKLKNNQSSFIQPCFATLLVLERLRRSSPQTKARSHSLDYLLLPRYLVSWLWTAERIKPLPSLSDSETDFRLDASLLVTTTSIPSCQFSSRHRLLVGTCKDPVPRTRTWLAEDISADKSPVGSGVNSRAKAKRR